MYATGRVLNDEEVMKVFNKWYNRYKNNDPFSSFAVFLNNEFIGHSTLGHSGHPGISECSILLLKPYWGKGYGYEISNTMVNEYSHTLIEENYLIDGEPLKKVLATARTDNIPSNKMLMKCGFKKTKENILYGNNRNFYELNINK
ncbi:hypothetical protein DICPUDRAFT_92697 [Dictyostelium purpureum]|uniref:N-acetyltransferase domain-containing protein n=1 Tax=Dictyostelium purpureum TaxID=5786 RepID=F0ZVS9_DICPU|nr:uncharacterized protein DICPUDRAFT_92697 [Dictyostelium purpureum]EGC31952.1 hypothetical protein DICPUDRAFT_92697 [Dictyostelium purpureum]|eukprot:XP_003291521.1 hypothetical protein DICPUDRAFT_92697 [Dictyostelium purpureum]